MNTRTLRYQVLNTMCVLCSLLSGGIVFAEGFPSSEASEAGRLTIGQPIHFQTADNEDLLLEPGTYGVAAERGGLRLTSSTEGGGILLHALPSIHDAVIAGPAAVLIPQGEDERHLVLAFPNGTSLDAAGSLSGIKGRGPTMALSSAVSLAAAQSRPISSINECGIGGDPPPNVTRWRPFGRVWPGGKIVFEGSNLDPSRFEAVIGSAPQPIRLPIVSASPGRIEVQVPMVPNAGPYTPPGGTKLTVSYKGGTTCRLLNPSFVVAEAFSLTRAALLESDIHNHLHDDFYFWLHHQLTISGEIEGIRTLQVLDWTVNRVKALIPDPRQVCDWREVPAPFGHGRSITLNNNRIRSQLYGSFKDPRVPLGQSNQSMACKLPVEAVIVDVATNVSHAELFLIPLSLRVPRTVAVNSTKVIPSFVGVEPSPYPFGPKTGASGDCGNRLPQNSSNAAMGLRQVDSDWRFTLKSGALPATCVFNTRPLRASLETAFYLGDFETSKQGDPHQCQANAPALGQPLIVWQPIVTLSCNFGPLGDNRVDVRAKSITLMIPTDRNPLTMATEFFQ